MSFTDAGRPLQQALSLWADYQKTEPALQAVLDSSKKNHFVRTELANQIRFSGKNRNIIVNSYLPECNALATDCSASICDAGESIAPTQTTLSINDCIATLNHDLLTSDVRLIDGNITFSDNAVMQILALLDNLRKGLSKKVIAKIVAGLGTHNDGSASKQIAFNNPLDSSLRPLGMWDIMMEFRDIGLSDPYIMGGSDVFTWIQNVRNGGLNAQGLQTNRMHANNMYYDANVEAAFGDQTVGHVIAYDPRSIKFISYVENADIFATTPYESIKDLDALYRVSGNSIKGTYSDPVTGLLFDLNVIRVDCPVEKFTFNLKMNFDLWQMPPYFCANSAGVNGLFGYTTCKSVPASCPPSY